MTKPANPVQMAVIGAAHGIKGELRVKSFTADTADLGAYGPLYAADGRRFEVESVRPAGAMVVVRFKGVADRTAAERLTGTALFVDRSVLPQAEEDEFYHADLVGLTVEDESGNRIGRVTAVQNFGGGDILDVARAGGSVLIPFTRAAVPHVDLKAGTVTVDSVAAGLVDDEDEPDAAAARPRGPREAGGNR